MRFPGLRVRIAGNDAFRVYRPVEDVPLKSMEGRMIGTSAATGPTNQPVWDRLAFARKILHQEADALRVVADRIDARFSDAIDQLFHCSGRILVSGIGKSSDIGLKIVGTLNSTGTRAHHLDATKALHGDLGSVAPDDISLLLSHSGESEELIRLIRPLRKLAGGIIALTSNPNSTLARAADHAIIYGPVVEACPNALAPSTSTTIMLAIGDAIAFTLSEMRQFSADDFARYHPAGSLGRKLLTVDALMRTGPEMRLAQAGETVRSVFARVRHEGRRTGAIILTHPDGTLAGLFTDSDLARLFEKHADGAFDRPICEVMTATPTTVPPSARVVDVVELMRTRKLSEVPVIDATGVPVGMLDITDLIGIDPTLGVLPNGPTLRLFPHSNG